MNDDELRERIARNDPALGGTTSPITGAAARELLEEIMNTPLDTRHDDSIRPDTAPQVGGAPTRRATFGGARRGWLAGAAAVGVGGLALAGAAIGGAFSSGPQAADAPPVVLSLGEGQDPMASCLPVSADVLAPVPLAFAGTATEVDGERVVLDVTTWYAGGDAETVELTATAGMEALIGGIEFEVGQPYLVSAYDGIVSYCGLSGPATPELQAVYDAAFPG